MSDTTFGASIVPSPSYPKSGQVPTLNSLDSPALTPAVSAEDLNRDYQGKPIPPHSPFYQHPPQSFEKVQSHSRNGSRVDVAAPTEKDLEMGAATPLAAQEDHPFASKVSVDCSKECKMWPSKQTLMQDQQARRKEKHDKKTFGKITEPITSTWSRFTKRQKLYIQIALALVLVGVVVAIAVGITVAVNGRVYAGENRNKAIPDPSEQQ